MSRDPVRHQVGGWPFFFTSRGRPQRGPSCSSIGKGAS